MSSILNDILTWTLRTANNFREFIDAEGHTWVEQNTDKETGWAREARHGRHQIAWEFVNGSYTGRVLLDGEIMPKAVAAEKLWGYPDESALRN